MRSALTFFSGIICCSLLFSSCDTDVDLLAPYKSTAVIYAVLDHTVDTQFVRINRTFLADGDANQYAQIKDSVEYSPEEVDAWLIKKKNGVVLDSIQLEYFVKPSRDSGVFYNQNVGFWITSAPLFNEEELNFIRIASTVSNPITMSYSLRVTARGEVYEGETTFPTLNVSTILTPAAPTNQGFTKIALIFAAGDNRSYTTYTFSFRMNNRTSRYQGVFRMNYEYITNDGQLTTGQTFDYDLGTRQNPDLSDNATRRDFPMNTENWYRSFGDEIRSLGDVDKVRLVNCEFRLTGSNSELNRYLNVAQPISDFTPVLRAYSNLSNDAVGLLASRATLAQVAYVTEETLELLNIGEFTSGPCYCNVNWAGSNYVCTDTGCP